MGKRIKNNIKLIKSVLIRSFVINYKLSLNNNCHSENLSDKTHILLKILNLCCAVG